MVEQAAGWVKREVELANSRLLVGGFGAHSSLGEGMIARFALRCCQAVLSLCIRGSISMISFE